MHINLLRRAKALRNYLVVVLSWDEFNSIEKGKITYFTFQEGKNSYE